MAWDHDIDRCVDAWLDAGLRAIGVNLPQLGRDDPERVARRLRAAGLAVSSLQGIGIYDLGGTSRRGRDVCRELDLAALLGAECVVALTGPRGDLAWEDAADEVVEQTRRVLPELRARGLRLAMEPVSPIRQDLSFVNLASDAVEIVQRVGDPSFGYVFDTYHLWWQRGIESLARASAPHVLCAQVSDHKAVTLRALDRALPGEGIIPLRGLLRALEDGGYDGWWELEVLSDAHAAVGIDRVLDSAVRAAGALWAA
jgi:sugar phosphate isomerase/epimerase